MVFQRLYSFKMSPGTCPRTTHRISPSVTPFGGRYSVPPTFTTALTPLATFQATPITEQPIDIYVYKQTVIPYTIEFEFNKFVTKRKAEEIGLNVPIEIYILPIKSTYSQLTCYITCNCW
jgi:hypothetical protein